MTDIFALMNAISDASNRDREKYHVTLGGLIEALEKADDAALVVFDDGTAAGDMDSYRGYYVDIAIDDAKEPKPVSEWRSKAKSTVGQTFIGYKGGEYLATENKPLWRSEYGTASGIAITGIHASRDAFVLLTKQVN